MSFIERAIREKAANFEVFTVRDVANELGMSIHLVFKAVEKAMSDNVIKNVEVEKIPGRRGRQAPSYMAAN